MTTQLSTRELHPAPLFTPTPQAAKRMLEFFTAQINNPHTRRAYLNAARRFAAWCQDHRIGRLAEVQPVHVAAFIQDLQGQLAPATVKQHLAALYDRPKSRFTYKRTFKAELIGSCGQALHELKIDEDAEKVVSRFIAGGFLEGYYEEEEKIREARKRLR